MYTLDALLTGQWGTLLDAAQHLVLPAVTLAIGRRRVGSADYARVDA